MVGSIEEMEVTRLHNILIVFYYFLLFAVFVKSLILYECIHNGLHFIMHRTRISQVVKIIVPLIISLDISMTYGGLYGSLRVRSGA